MQQQSSCAYLTVWENKHTPLNFRSSSSEQGLLHLLCWDFTRVMTVKTPRGIAITHRPPLSAIPPGLPPPATCWSCDFSLPKLGHLPLVPSASLLHHTALLAAGALQASLPPRGIFVFKMMANTLLYVK